MSERVYTPTDAESGRLLANVEKWVQALRKHNVGADIAAHLARDFLSPMRIDANDKKEEKLETNVYAIGEYMEPETDSDD